jgi:hypothetical protein
MRINHLTLAISVASLLSLPGCDGPRVQGEMFHSQDAAGNLIQYAAVGLIDGQRIFGVLVLADSAGFSIVGSTTGPNFREGKHSVTDDRKVTWSCDSWDGRTGEVIIDGEKFDLANGRVFLVAQIDDKSEVKQVAADISQLRTAGPADHHWFERAKAMVPEIETFIDAMPPRLSQPNRPPPLPMSAPLHSL